MILKVLKKKKKGDRDTGTICTATLKAFLSSINARFQLLGSVGYSLFFMSKLPILRTFSLVVKPISRRALVHLCQTGSWLR